MSVEKTVVVAISALLGSCAALKSRKSRFQAVESLEASLSNATVVQKEHTRSSLTKDQRGPNLRSWVLMVHALVSCCVVWYLTGKSQNNGWVVACCSGLAIVLVMHIAVHLAPKVPSNSPNQTANIDTVLLVDDDYLYVCNGRWIKDRYVVVLTYLLRCV